MHSPQHPRHPKPMPGRAGKAALPWRSAPRAPGVSVGTERRRVTAAYAVTADGPPTLGAAYLSAAAQMSPGGRSALPRGGP